MPECDGRVLRALGDQLFMAPCLMVFRCGSMMFCGVLMMLGGFPVIFSTLFRHINPLFLETMACAVGPSAGKLRRIITTDCDNGVTHK
jgi:hypothetical protein